MTEDSAIRIGLTLQSLYTLPTHGASPTPKTPGTHPTGSLELAPASSELDIPNETDIPMSPLPHHRHTYTNHVLGSPGVIPTLPPHGSNHHVAQNLYQTGTGPKHTGCQDYRRHLIRVTAARSLPTLVNTCKRSPPVYRIKACPYKQLWLYGKSSVRWLLVNVQIRFMRITTCSSYHEGKTK